MHLVGLGRQVVCPLGNVTEFVIAVVVVEPVGIKLCDSSNFPRTPKPVMVQDLRLFAVKKPMRHYTLPLLFASFILVGVIALSSVSASGLSQGTPTRVNGSLGIDLPAGSQFWTSIPFTRPPEFVGRIESVTGDQITVAVAPNWQPGRFVYSEPLQKNSYFALIGSKTLPLAGTISFATGRKSVTGTDTTFGRDIVVGDSLILRGQTYVVTHIASEATLSLDRPVSVAGAEGIKASFSHSPREGRTYAVTGNDTTAITVEAGADDLAALTPGTSISLIPYWTLGRVFPAKDAGQSFIARTLASKGTTIELTPSASPSTGGQSPAVYYFWEGAWRQAGRDAVEVHNDDVLPSDACFTVENPAGKATVLHTSGTVHMQRLCIPLATEPDAVVDNAVGLLRPVPVTLDTLGLAANHAFVKTDALGQGDRLLLQGRGENGKPVVESFYLDRQGWHLDGGDAAVDMGSTTIVQPGTGLVIGKAPQPVGIDLWSNPPGYSQAGKQ